jgi:predicted amidohydrolase
MPPDSRLRGAISALPSGCDHAANLDAGDGAAGATVTAVAAMAHPRQAVLRLALDQLAPQLGEPAANLARIGARAAAAAADLHVTPELAVTGYDVRDRARQLAVPLTAGSALPPAVAEPLGPAGPGALVLGLIERGRDGVAYNAAAVVRRGVVEAAYRKIRLPTYGMFDEGRYFGHGERLLVFDAAPGWRAGLLICEDFWHPGLLYVLAAAGIDVLLVQAAAPGRGVWEGGEGGGRFASADVWERIARTAAQQYGIYVALCNRVGVEGGITFAGGSLVAAPDGRVMARAGDAAEDVVSVELAADMLRAARVPYYHGRDDDPALIVRELDRLARR